jgi:hypothetical protein
MGWMRPIGFLLLNRFRSLFCNALLGPNTLLSNYWGLNRNTFWAINASFRNFRRVFCNAFRKKGQIRFWRYWSPNASLCNYFGDFRSLLNDLSSVPGQGFKRLFRVCRYLLLKLDLLILSVFNYFILSFSLQQFRFNIDLLLLFRVLFFRITWWFFLRLYI